MGRSGYACSLVMPFRNEARSLPLVLASIAAQKVSRDRLRFIAVDSASSDGGAALVGAWLAENGIAGEVIRLERAGISAALNAGIARAGADDVVVRLDAHTTYAPGYLSTLLDALEAAPLDVWWVGGRQAEFAFATRGALLVRALMTNPMGLGGTPWRSRTGLRPADSAYLGAFRPGVLQRLGGFDEAWIANEDAELAGRIHAAGGRVYVAPAGCTYHITRSALGTLGQWLRYGFWRAHTMLRHPETIRRRQLAPPLALALFTLVACTPLRPALLLPIAAFAALVVAFRAKGEPVLVTAASIVYFPCTHASFACGLLAGSIDALLLRPRSPAGARGVPARRPLAARNDAAVPVLRGELTAISGSAGAEARVLRDAGSFRSR